MAFRLPPNGTTFAGQAGRINAPRGEGLAVEPRKLRVLVVDDEYLSRWTARQLLARRGHEVEEAASGEAALEKLERWNPDVILLDVGLPGMGGIAFLHEVGRWRPAIPIILMTAHATVQTAVAAIRAGAVDYLTKPLNLDEMESALARITVWRPHGQARSA